MIKDDLVKQVSKRTNVTQKVVAEVVDAVTATIGEALARRELVKLSGFGIFDVAERAARVSRNPKTGAPVNVPAKAAPKFVPGAVLKEAVASGAAPGPRTK
jgi:DNA-binding protein HU-beta